MLRRGVVCAASCLPSSCLRSSPRTSCRCTANLSRCRTQVDKGFQFMRASRYLPGSREDTSRQCPSLRLPSTLANQEARFRSFSTNAPPTRDTKSATEHGPSNKLAGGKHGFGDAPFARKRDMDLKAGPYKRGRIFISPRDDPKEFILSCLVVFVMLYTLYHLPRGEYLWERRKRLIRERLLKEYGLTEADLDIIEGEEAPLSDEVVLTGPTSSADPQRSNQM
ncbi:hypothetical protein CSUI_005367 [Cystoisospora suis]|uniref:Uncharacterized protein n=1 Tax=Cystoisospora suis TaxID=483139 RepID=A0A2C6KY89_9APIC|nr:hypothetical protein CSUI_005367 [Cystoisospora suis]